jgi:hypothetical protein
MRFEDLVFEDSFSGKGCLLQFDENYQMSIVCNEHSYGGKQGLYEIAVYYNDQFKEMPGITQEGSGGVRGWLSEEMVSSCIVKMMSVTGVVPKLI